MVKLTLLYLISGSVNLDNIFLGKKCQYVSKALKDFIFFNSMFSNWETYSKIFMIFLVYQCYLK